MTTKQIIAQARKEKNIGLLILAYEKYYSEQRDKSSNDRIKELDRLPKYKKELILYNLLKGELLGITKEQADEIIKHYSEYNAEDLIKQFEG